MSIVNTFFYCLKKEFLPVVVFMSPVSLFKTCAVIHILHVFANYKFIFLLN